jgi:hypothetical protein
MKLWFRRRWKLVISANETERNDCLVALRARTPYVHLPLMSHFKVKALIDAKSNEDDIERGKESASLHK